MGKIIRKVTEFFRTGLWRLTPGDTSPWRFVAATIVKKVYLAVKFFTQRGVLDRASALTYNTLLAIVPMMAVIFAVARGFGFSKYIEVWFRDLLSSQPLVAETIIGFVNSYLIHTKSGIFLGIGLLFLLWTVCMLLGNIERAFNDIWQVKEGRGAGRSFRNYLAFFLLVPIVIIVFSGISLWIATGVSDISGVFVIGKAANALLGLLPFILMSALFVCLYVLVPNCKVHLRAALFPGILAGIAMQLLQMSYVDVQMYLSSYNAIYGSFAALPLFMLWVYISWCICLFGAQLSYTNQNLEQEAYFVKTDEISHRYRLLLSALLMSKICRRFSQEYNHPYTALQLKQETGIPIRIVQDLLDNLTRVHLLTAVESLHEKDGETRYLPVESEQHQTVGTLVDRLESMGKWTLDIDVKKQLEDMEWGEFYEVRHDYLSRLREIPLRKDAIQ